MGYSSLTPRTENITGADLSGTDGDTGRTYTFTYSNVLSSGIQIIVQGAPLHEGASLDFTVSASVVTFNNAIDNTDVIAIHYFTTVAVSGTSPLVTSTSLKYATPLQLAIILGIKKEIPTWAVGATPVNETVGTGDLTTGTFYLDHKNVISDSYDIYYGVTSATTTELTETTHYVLDKDTGKITLTTAGKTFLGTASIYAEYAYYDLDLNDSYIVEVMGRAEQEVDNLVNTSFTDGTDSNPAYPSATDILDSQGKYNRNYFSIKRPLIDVADALADDITAASTSFDVSDGTKFPSSGLVIIDHEMIAYTTLSTNTFSGLTRGYGDSDAAVHAAGASVHTTIMEVSGTEEGTVPSWQPLAWDSDMYADDTGRFQIYRDELLEGVYVSPALMSNHDIAQRCRLRYYYGYETVPVDITRLTLLLSKRMLLTDNIGASMIKGRNEFRPEMLNADQEEIERIVRAYEFDDITNT